MEPIVDYDVAAGAYLDSLVAQVRDFIKKGWEPQGGLCTYEYGLFYQVIVKREKKISTDALGLLERWRIEEAIDQ